MPLSVSCTAPSQMPPNYSTSRKRPAISWMSAMGTMLFLKGQYLPQYLEETEDDQPRFPLHGLQYCQRRHAVALILDVQYLGPPLTPSLMLDPEEEGSLMTSTSRKTGKYSPPLCRLLIDDLKRLNEVRKSNDNSMNNPDSDPLDSRPLLARRPLRWRCFWGTSSSWDPVRPVGHHHGGRQSSMLSRHGCCLLPRMGLHR